MISTFNIILLQNKFTIEPVCEGEYSSLAQTLSVWAQSIDVRADVANSALMNCKAICNTVHLELIDCEVDDVYTCKYQGEVEGFMVIYNPSHRDNLHINWLCSNPKNIRRFANAVLGVGNAMLDATKLIAQETGKAFIDTMPYMAAKPFYARNDFEEEFNGSMFFLLEPASNAAL